ncbi:MAG: SH3 domain-containing protein [Treponema sp.]|nr:SH3 domain-containing protein [Treponema sp.]
MKNFGKKIGISFLCAIFSLVSICFFSCSNEIIGYSVVLWNIPEALIADGEVVPVYMKSNISKTYLIGTPDESQRIEIPLWKITEPMSKGKANKYATTNAYFNRQYAVSVIDGLPIRKDPTNSAKQVYRLRKGEIIRACYIGKGDTPMNGHTPLEGDWYKVLTSTGIDGWCFSYNLRTFEIQADGSYDYDGEGMIKVESANNLLDAALASLWYPEYYAKMINKKEINLDYMQEDYGFDPGSTSGTVTLKLQNVDVSYPYEGVTKTADSVYKFTGTPITMTIRGENSIVLRFSDTDGKPATVYFVTIDDDVPTLIQDERARRQRVYSTLMRSGPTYNSTNFGVLTFTGGNKFQWSGFDNLQPSIIPADAGHSGTMVTKYFLPTSLKSIWDGVLTFVFSGTRSEVNFLYKVEANGLRMTTARVSITKDLSSGRENAEVSMATESQVIFFLR